MKNLIITLLLVLFATAFYAMESPVDIEITHPGAYVILQWNPIADAIFYKVFTCDTPYGEFELDEAGRFLTATSWTKAEPAGKKFYQVTAVNGPLAVDLGTAGNFVILAKAAISSATASEITGDVGISPAAASYITGFSLTLDATNTFATSTQVSGRVYAADYTPPTPSNLTTAISNFETAYVDAAGRSNPNFINLGSGDISGMTLVPGIYTWDNGVTITAPITLSGGQDDVWIFQISQGITMNPNSSVILGGSAQARNIFWQAVGPVTLGTDAHLEGNVLSSTNIALGVGASVNGRLLAQTAVTLDDNTITIPSP